MEEKLIDIFTKIGERSKWPKYFDDSETLRKKIECYSSRLMNIYDSGGTAWDFQHQLIKWLNNVDSIKNKYLLINSLSYFTFFNRGQFIALCREALCGPTVKWLIDIENYDITDPLLNSQINQSISLTLFSAATDSMSINDFRHACKPMTVKTTGQTWLDYIKHIDSEEEKKVKAQSYQKLLHNKGYKRIVVLEDFVGTGNQIKNILDFLGCFKKWPILVIPLLVCPQGNSAIPKHLRKRGYDHISYEPVSILPWELILADKRPKDSMLYSPLLTELKKFARITHEKLGIGYLGYKKVGALCAKYANCPNNTLPLYHNKSDKWEPLFERSDR